MGWFKEFVRVANGVALVAKEAVLSGTQQGSSAESLIKIGFVSATDLVGLTKGTPRQFSPRIQKNGINQEINGNKNDANQESVVFFKDEIKDGLEPETVPEMQENEVKLEAGPQIQENVAECVVVESEAGNVDLGIQEMRNQGSPMQLPVLANRKRKPRERRVPSTPFSRAIG